ncbi:hypothetical protein [Streptomyces hydrogenans]|uniref:hypothetical protein n=1 Tax=Streptomyces hydrogenans TaxID=1873719 RepID=UPI00380EED2F
MIDHLGAGRQTGILDGTDRHRRGSRPGHHLGPAGHPRRGLGSGAGASVHWAVTAALGMAITGLVRIVDAVGSFSAAVGRATPWQDPHDIDLINTALLLRRPLLVTGRPGIGRSTLTCLVTCELGLGRVLRWGITSRSTLRFGLYEYDAIGRAHASLGHPRPAAPAPGPAFGSPGEPPGAEGADPGSGTSSAWARWAPPCCHTSCRRPAHRRVRQERHRPAQRPPPRPGERLLHHP